ncbi:hypothetical protein FA95DRAFT_1597783 [Auriscalpium vulgare]|uniref:Uncharacterized protein n=1 Tax=Auriscalpium vulgare TaxID=40419 RepID=A0ACB8RJ89_9AGAM|nr:hypothetical protein FA95DRAFT_1597783 [Auriscalpium vulgare]
MSARPSRTLPAMRPASCPRSSSSPSSSSARRLRRAISSARSSRPPPVTWPTSCPALSRPSRTMGPSPRASTRASWQTWLRARLTTWIRLIVMTLQYLCRFHGICSIHHIVTTFIYQCTFGCLRNIPRAVQQAAIVGHWYLGGLTLKTVIMEVLAPLPYHLFAKSAALARNGGVPYAQRRGS